MKRFVLVLKILVLVLLMSLISVGCDEVTEWAEVSNDKVAVGKQVKLSVTDRESDTFGCARAHYDKVAGEMYSWRVEPSDGATVKDGVFVASKPGKYKVTPVEGTRTDNPIPRTIVVEGTAAETIADETTVTETTAQAEESNNEQGSDIDITAQDTDSGLIHGVVPTKVTGHSTGTGQSKDVGILEFWNIGKLGGEQYSKATYIITRDGKTIATWEGYFTGGPNGDIYLSGDTELHGTLVDGKQLIGDGHGIADIDNPEAFDGWKD
jgi:hypothetical protein